MNWLMISSIILASHFNAFLCYTPQTILDLDFDNGQRPFTQTGTSVSLVKAHQTIVANVFITDFSSITLPTSNTLKCKTPFQFGSQRSNYFCVNNPLTPSPNVQRFECETSDRSFAECQTGYFIILNERIFSSRLFFNQKMTLSKDYDYILKFSYVLDQCNDEIEFQFGLTRFTTDETKEIVNSKSFPYQIIKKWIEHESIFRVGVDGDYLIQMNATNKGCGGFIAIDELKLIQDKRNEAIPVNEIVFESDSITSSSEVQYETTLSDVGEFSTSNSASTEQVALTRTSNSQTSETSESGEIFTSTISSNLEKTSKPNDVNITGSIVWIFSTEYDNLASTSERSLPSLEPTTSNLNELTTSDTYEINDTSLSSQISDHSTIQQLEENASTLDNIVINSDKSKGLTSLEIGLIVAGCGLALIAAGSFIFWKFKIKPQRKIGIDQTKSEPNLNVDVDEHSV